MSAIARIGRGCHLGIRSLLVVLRDKTLLLFPMIPITCAIAAIVVLSALLGGDDVLWALLLTHMANAKSLAIAFGLYIMMAAISVFSSVGLVSCTRITLDERDSKFLDGAFAALRKVHWIFLWAFISWTIGPVFNLLDHLRYTSKWVRKILKTNWSLLSYFLIPVMVVDDINLFSAIGRSRGIMEKTWGPGAISRLGFAWFFLLMNTPSIALVAYVGATETVWSPPLTLLLVLWIYLSIVVYQTANAVLSVVLYKYALDGTVARGFKEAHLKAAFVKPKVYVLVDEDSVSGVAAENSATPKDETTASDEASDAGDTTAEPEANESASTETTTADDNDPSTQTEPSDLDDDATTKPTDEVSETNSTDDEVSDTTDRE
ncbi:MAG: DUF6159 family protein [Candidatus Hydrogenedentes bacterium]|nr:DUF6159 family protein [Candidatus Hydrogenedentota bacterium]